MNDSAALRQLKSDLGLTWRQMGNALDVHPRTVQNIAIEDQPMTNGMRRRIRQVYGIDMPDVPLQQRIRENEDRIEIGCLVLRIDVPRLSKAEADMTARILDREGWPWTQRRSA